MFLAWGRTSSLGNSASFAGVERAFINIVTSPNFDGALIIAEALFYPNNVSDDQKRGASPPRVHLQEKHRAETERSGGEAGASCQGR